MINNTKRLFVYFVEVSGYKGITKNQLKKITKTITPRKIRGFIILAFAKQASLLFDGLHSTLTTTGTSRT